MRICDLNWDNVLCHFDERDEAPPLANAKLRKTFRVPFRDNCENDADFSIKVRLT